MAAMLVGFDDVIWPQEVPFHIQMPAEPKFPYTKVEGLSLELTKLAVTVWAAFMVTQQVVPSTDPHPVQPAKLEPELRVADRVTWVPLLMVAEQVLPQLIPPEELVTLPEPSPDFWTLS